MYDDLDIGEESLTKARNNLVKLKKNLEYTENEIKENEKKSFDN